MNEDRLDAIWEPRDGLLTRVAREAGATPP